MQVVLWTAVLIGATAAPLMAQDRDQCRHEAQRSATVDANGARRLVISAGSGSLRIEGKPGITTVRITGRACASSADLLDDIRLNARRSDADVIVEANDRQNEGGWNFRGNEYARLDLVMEVPARIAAEIDDGSGSIDLSNLGALLIEDGSGEITGDNLNGDVEIDDGSGTIRLVDVTGSVRIEDGSGEISLRNIGGRIDIDDGSGEIDVRGARNTVRINDSSGGIDVADVDGDFIVVSDSSGGIDYDNVKGRVDIPRGRR
jgi:DUF4097 and DUF4098 domain-containing protein YvlB